VLKDCFSSGVYIDCNFFLIKHPKPLGRIVPKPIAFLPSIFSFHELYSWQNASYIVFFLAGWHGCCT
jgi:hypothetical protein